MKLNLRKISIFFGLLLVLNACKKDEFTEPVKANMVVKLAEGTSAYVSFQSGEVLFEQILFDGHRQQGGDVHFTTESGKEIGPVSFTQSAEGFVKHFDIPQGVYTHMQWHFLLGDMELDSSDDEEEDEPEEIEVDGGLVFNGWYTRTDGTQDAIRIAIEEDELLVAKAIADNASDNITLTASNSYDIELIFDPYYAVRPISLDSWENAEVNSDNDQRYIEISEDENEALYEAILFRMESSLKVLIK